MPTDRTIPEPGDLQDAGIEDENTIACWRCEEQTPMSEMIAVHAEWVCGVCYDDL